MLLKNLTKSKRSLVITLCFLFIFVISNINVNNLTNLPKTVNNSISKSNDKNDLGELKPSTSTVIIDNKTIFDGQDLYEGQSYWFNGSVYDMSLPTRKYTSAYLETSFNGGYTIYSNDSLTYNNTETKIRTAAQTTMTNGTNRGSGTFWGTNYAGHHDGAYSFTFDAVGANPAGWTVVGTGGTVNVIASMDSSNCPHCPQWLIEK